jgi:hypothetical protein
MDAYRSEFFGRVTLADEQNLYAQRFTSCVQVNENIFGNLNRFANSPLFEPQIQRIGFRVILKPHFDVPP